MSPARDPLPPRLRMAFIAISEFPRTNSITIVGILMFVATGVFLGLASMGNYEITEGVLVIWLSAVLAVMGIGNWAESIKRRLPYPSPPTPPDAENVAATSGTPAPAAPIAPDPAAVVRKPMPESVTALKAGVLAKTADPTKPVGELVDGEGD